MNDLGSEVREFGRFLIRQLRYDYRIRNSAWIGAEDPINVGPDRYRISSQQCAEDRS